MGTPERELAGGRQKADRTVCGNVGRATLSSANFGYGSRGSADPCESLRKRRILKLALTAHKVLLADSAIGFLAVYWL